MIPLAKDTREAIGDFAEKVENRSLLFEKIVLPKKKINSDIKLDDAQRFNVLRATHDGRRVLQEERNVAQRDVRKGKNVQQNRYKEQVASQFSEIKVDYPQLKELSIRSHNQFLSNLGIAYPKHSVTFIAQLGGRLLINMSGGVLENAGLALSRLTGLPFIPGSAIKGATRHVALWEIREERDHHKKIELLKKALTIFGYTSNDFKSDGDFYWAAKIEENNEDILNQAREKLPEDSCIGTLSFLDAHPSGENNLKITAEVLTPHFNNKKDPAPIFFPAVDAGSEFGFAIVAHRLSPSDNLNISELLKQAKAWLLKALTQNGIGAKTGAGYGWFQIDPQGEKKFEESLLNETKKIEEEDRRTKEKAEKLKKEREEKAKEEQRINALTPKEKLKEEILALGDEKFANFANNLANKNEDEQRVFIEILCNERKEARKRWKKNKRDLWESLTKIASDLNIQLS